MKKIILIIITSALCVGAQTLAILHELPADEQLVLERYRFQKAEQELITAAKNCPDAGALAGATAQMTNTTALLKAVAYNRKATNSTNINQPK